MRIAADFLKPGLARHSLRRTIGNGNFRLQPRRAIRKQLVAKRARIRRRQHRMQRVRLDVGVNRQPAIAVIFRLIDCRDGFIEQNRPIDVARGNPKGCAFVGRGVANG